MNTTQEIGRTAAHRPPAQAFMLDIDGERFSVGSLAHASILFLTLRDAAGGSREFPDGIVTGDGETFRVSFNGHVWLGARLYLEAE